MSRFFWRSALILLTLVVLVGVAGCRSSYPESGEAEELVPDAKAYGEAVVLGVLGPDSTADWVRTDIAAACMFCADCVVTYYTSEVTGAYGPDVFPRLAAEAERLGGAPQEVIHALSEYAMSVKVPGVTSLNTRVAFVLEDTALSIEVFVDCHYPSE